MPKRNLHFSISEKEYSTLSFALIDCRLNLKKLGRGEHLQENIWKLEKKISSQLKSQKHTIVNLQETK